MALLILLAQAGPPIEDLAHESRAVREAAIRGLAAGGPASAEIAARLADPDDRIALGAAEVLRLRRDPDVVEQLVRAADGPDATRGAAAAAALLATASAARLEVESFRTSGMAALPSRLDDAYRDAVRETLVPLAFLPSTDRPQRYRDLLGGGRHAARALSELASDPGAPGPARAHALHALARLTGEAPTGWLADAEPDVRAAAAALVLRYGDPEALRLLSARLDEAGALHSTELHSGALAARRTGKLGPAGVAALSRAVRDREVSLAADAAAALLAVDREAGMPVVQGRVLRHLAEAERVAGMGVEAAIFEIRAGPLPDDLRARMRALDDPLLRACACDDPIATLRPLLGEKAGKREGFRIEICERILCRGGASDEDRVRFATSALASDVAAARRAGLSVLTGASAKGLEALLPAVTAALREEDESLRVAAAALLLPDPRAVAVCADALYDGDPWTAMRVAAVLDEKGLATVDGGAPVAARRRASLDLGRRTLRGKE